MTKRKTTKRALVSSAFALILCFTMLLGTTFAWFTDTASTGSSVIQSGTLDIELQVLENGEWVSAEGKELSFTKADTTYGTEALLEPGATYVLPKVRIVNKGTLSAKAILKFAGITEDAKLLDALEVKTTLSESPIERFDGKSYMMADFEEDGLMNLLCDWFVMPAGKTAGNGLTDKSPEYTISVHMKEDAGNEYQGLTLGDVSIVVLATQGDGEYDSFGSNYDIDAVLPSDPTKTTETP